jgi:hypothetical protein
VSATGGELHAAQSAVGEMTEEVGPERLVLRVTDVDPDDPAVLIPAHGSGDPDVETVITGSAGEEVAGDGGGCSPERRCAMTRGSRAARPSGLSR